MYLFARRTIRRRRKNAKLTAEQKQKLLEAENVDGVFAAVNVTEDYDDFI